MARTKKAATKKVAKKPATKKVAKKAVPKKKVSAATASTKKPAKKPRATKQPIAATTNAIASTNGHAPPSAGAIEAFVTPIFTFDVLGTDALVPYVVPYPAVPKAVQKQCGSNAKTDKPNNRNLFYRVIVDDAPAYLYFYQYKPNPNATTTGLDVFTETGMSYGNGEVDDANTLTWNLYDPS